MTEISLSLNRLESTGRAIEVAEHTLLRDLLPGLLRMAEEKSTRDSDLSQYMVVISRPAQHTENTFHELGIQTGDLLTLTPQSPQSGQAQAGNRTIFFQVFRDSGDTLEVADHMTLADALGWLPPEPRSRHRRAPEGPLIAWCGRVVPDLSRPPAHIGLTAGMSLSLVEVRLHSSRLSLLLASPRGLHAPFRINYSPAILGRYDRNLADLQLDIDLSTVLQRGKERSVSRRQAEFIEEYGIWRVQLHNDARVPMFVDNQRLLPGLPVALSENNVLSFGSSPNQPDFQLVVHLEAE